MKSLWNEVEAAQFAGDLGQRVYASRLLGADPDLVLHGGGNTSVKITEPDIFGKNQDLLYVKGSGWDLETIEAEGFAPVHLDYLIALSKLDNLSDTQMANELITQRTRTSAPTPSVEAILHALLPHKFVDHTHADAIIAVTNSPDGPGRVEAIYGESVVIIPYVMPGFKLARLVADLFPKHAHRQTIGLILLNHGVFSFGNTARESYERMITLVDQAEQYLLKHSAWTVSLPAAPPRHTDAPLAVASLRQAMSRAAGFPLILSTADDDESLSFANLPNLAAIAGRGPATPDHVIRTKRLPLIGRDVAAYVDAYGAYFAENASRSAAPLTMVDPAPRIVLDSDLGLLTAGRTAHETRIARDLYQHTVRTILRSEALGGWQALPAADIFDVEYWDLEQAKLRKAGRPARFAGEIALVTGAASGIGRACAEAFMAEGAAVVALDINPAVESLFSGPAALGLRCDVSDENALRVALNQAVDRFGGLDMLILNAGIFPSSKKIEAMPPAEWQRTMDINLTANLTLMRLAHPLLKRAPKNGRVVVIGSKNVPAPGPGAAAYSVSKAALTQLARVAAMEWAPDGIQVNITHPNQVFDTALWTEEILTSRAANYKMSIEDYKKNNLLHITITSRDVAALAVEMCGAAFSRTTGAQVPIDGGNDRVL